MSQSPSPTETELIEAAFERLAADLAMIADRSLTIEAVRAQIAHARPAGEGEVHVSFKLGFRLPAGSLHGCLLMPLPDALSLACYLMMVPDDQVEARREDTTLDSSTKDAMIEIGNFLAGAIEASLRTMDLEHVRVMAEGCQGVRADVRPAFLYREGDALFVGRAQAKLHSHPPFEMLLMLPRAALALPLDTADAL